MNKYEINRRSEELDALLDGLPADLPTDDSQLVQELMNLSSRIQPDIHFSLELGRRLEAAGLQQKMASIWQTLVSRRVLLPLAGAAIALWLILFGLPHVNNPTQVNVLQPSPSGPVSNPIQLARTTLSVPINLPPLPLLGPSSAQAATNLSELFPKVDWTLQATLPEEPAEAAVYSVYAPESFTLETGKTMAARLGLNGEAFAIQRSEQPSLLEYFVVDGLARVYIYDDEEFTLIPDITHIRNEHSQPLPFEQLAARAETYLKERGLLDFDYTVQPGWLRTDEVVFTRILDGYPLLGGDPQQTHITVSIGADGSIHQVNYRGLRLEFAGRYPLRSAAAAWQSLLSGKLSGRFGYQVITVLPPFQPLHWSNKFEVNQRADLYGQVGVYKPIETSKPLLVTVEDIPIQGDLKGLESSQEFIHVWGTVQTGSHGLELALEGWEPSPVPESYYGILEKDGNAVMLNALEGRRFELVAPPDELPLGEPAIVIGTLSSDSSQIVWATIGAGRQICQTYTSSYMYVGTDGGGGGGGGGGGAPPELCARYGNTNASVIAGGFGNIQSSPGGAAGTAPAIITPYQPGDRIEGLAGELVGGAILLLPDGTKRPQLTVEFPGSETQPYWTAELVGENLVGLETLMRLNLRIWGSYTLLDGRPKIQVERFEAVNPEEHVQAWLGTLQVETIEGRKAVLLTTLDGTKFLLESSIKDPATAATEEEAITPTPNGEKTLVEGVLYAPEKDRSGYPVIRFMMIENPTTRKDLNDYTLSTTQLYEITPQPSLADLIQGPAKVEKVALVYLTTGLEDSALTPDDPARYIQPLWSFSGHLEDGHEFNIFVQAVQDEYMK